MTYEDIQFDLPEHVKIEQMGLATLDKIKALTVKTNEDYEVACQLELGIKARIQEGKIFFEPGREAKHRAWKNWLDLEEKALKPYQDALRIVVKERLAFELERECIRKEMEREEQRKATEKAKEEARQLADIVRETGEPELAKAIMADVQPPVVPPMERLIPTVKGISSRTIPDFHIIAVDKIDRKFMVPDETKIRSLVRSLGKKAEKVVGGIQVFQRVVGTSRTPR